MTLHLLPDNISPNSSINVDRKELQHDYQGVNRKIAQIEAQINSLTAEHEKLTSRRLSGSLIEKLSDGILQRIFYWARSSQNSTCVPFSRREAPMQLTQVCSKWREVAHGTPSIWRRLKCTFYLRPGQYERQATIAFIQSWIARAASTTTLSIHAVPFDSDSALTNLEPESASPFLPHPMNSENLDGEVAELPPWLLLGNKLNFIKDIVVPNAPNIRELRLIFPPYYRHTVAFLHHPTDLSSLEDLVIDLSKLTRSVNQHPDSCHNYSLLNKAPRLQKIEFKSRSMTHHLQLPINWSSITEFKTGTIDSMIFRKILRQMVSLRSWAADLYGDIFFEPFEVFESHGDVTVKPLPPKPPNVGAWTSPESIIHIHSLRSLTLSANIFIQELDIMDFPNLKSLSVTSSAWCKLSLHLLRTTISLSELNLTVQGQIAGNSLSDILKHPALSRLTHFSLRMAKVVPISNPLMTEPMNQEIMKNIAYGRLIPNLHTFEFEGELLSRSLIQLLVTKGFVSREDDGQVIYPNVEEEPVRTSFSPEHKEDEMMRVGAPFERVKIVNCKPDLTRVHALQKIQALVGSDRFILEMSEKDKWAMMDQIEWSTDASPGIFNVRPFVYYH